MMTVIDTEPYTNIIKIDPLRKCPFCGGTAQMVIVGHEQIIGPFYRVVCADCDAKTIYSDSMSKAAHAWNRRAGDGGTD